MVIILRQIDQVQRQCQKQKNSMSGRGIYMLLQLSTCEKEKTGFVDPVNLRSNITVKSFFTLQKQKWGEQQQKQLNCFTKV
jgi:predicted RNA-binding protein YlxR (DUF448 family)